MLEIAREAQRKDDASRIAVVAVHGVADQQPGATVRATADLLLRQAPEGVEYSAVTESRLRLAVRPPTSPSALESAGSRSAGWLGVRADKFDERPRAIRRRDEQRARLQRESHREDRAAAEPPDARELGRRLEHEERELEHDLMAEQLEGYRPGPRDRVYETLRLETTRIEDGKVSRVHLYEMFWADLSRLGDRHVGVLFDLYQLLFFVVKIGRKNLDSALHVIETAIGRSRSWRVARWCQKQAERLLALWVPVLNLTLLALASVLLVQLLPTGGVVVPLWLPVSVALGLGAALACYGWRERLARRAMIWPLLVLPALLLAGVAALVLRPRLPAWEMRPPEAAVLAWVVAAVGLFLVMRAYSRRRSGAKRAALAAIGLMSALYLWRLAPLWESSEWRPVFHAAIGAAAQFTIVLHLVWPLFILATLATIVAATLGARLAARRPALASVRQKKRLGRAAATTAITLIIPGLLVLLLNVALWQALVYVAKISNVKLGDTAVYMLNDQESYRWDGRRWEPCEQRASDPLCRTDAGFVQERIDEAYLPEFGWGLAALALALLFAVWALLPAVRSEAARPGETPERSAWLGGSLSGAFNVGLRMSGAVLLVLVVAVMTVMILFGSGRLEPGIGKGQEFVRVLVAGIGLALVVAVSGSRGPLRFLAIGLRSVLDVALDVANWVRNEPREETPRARICARYIALLRHLCHWRDPADPLRGYDRVVILAHSQGTVITADLLRFLMEELRRLEAGAETTLDRRQLRGVECLLSRSGQEPERPTYLFTVGSPLRQLYGRRLPFHYGWARHANAVPWPNHEPDPAELGVAAWANGYGAGDYIGRYLWHMWNTEDRFRQSRGGAGIHHRDGNKRELCVGVAGHTSYWRQPAVAEELDWLIAPPGHGAPG